MAKTFNTGVGMVAVVSKENFAEVITELGDLGEEVFVIGELVSRTAAGCILEGLESWN